MHKYQRITILPFFWNFTYRLQVSVNSALFSFHCGIAASYLLPPSLPVGEPLGEENVVDGVMDGWVEMLDVGCWMLDVGCRM